MTARRRIVGAVAAAGAALGLAAAIWAGALARPTDWRSATGWSEIPADRRPPAAPLWSGGSDEPRLEWLGHSGFRIEWAGTTLLLDPNLSPRCTVSARRFEPPLAAHELGAIDAALISHAHFDHLDLPTLSGVPSLGSILLPRGSEHDLAGMRPSTRIVPMAAGETRAVGGLEVTAVPAAHNGHRLHPLASRRPALGWIVRRGDDALYYAGDTGRRNDFDAIRREFRPRVAILPIGAYLPRYPMKYYHLSPEEAVDVAIELGVEAVVPCHFGTFTLALDHHAAALPRFAAAARARGVRWSMPPLPAGALDSRSGAAAR